MDTVALKLQPPEAEAFRPYGRLMCAGPVYPEVDPGEGRAAVEILTMSARAMDPIRVLAIHFSYNQAFIPVKGAMALIVAPPPRDARAGKQAHEYELDYGRLAAFRLEPGEGVIIDRGTWHTVVPLDGGECTYVNITRKDPGEGRSVELAQNWLATGHQPRAYIELVDLAKRDERMIQVRA